MTENPLALNGLHHVEFWVGNARQAAHYYQTAFGFSPFAYAGLETGSRDVSSVALRQGDAVLLLTAALTPDSPVADHVKTHGDGVRDIAFEVDDAEAAYRAALDRGATSADEPHEVSDGTGEVTRASVHTYGDTRHSFISKKSGSYAFLPGFQKLTGGEQPGAGLLLIDHIVGNVEDGQMDRWADWYKNVLGFHRYITFDDKDISTEFSALRSVVMSDDARRIKFPINEPADGRRMSQIQEYVEFYGGAGAQHLAMLTDDIIPTVRELRRRGVQFLDTPDTYYDTLLDRVGPIDEEIEVLRDLKILVDADDEGYLLQIFTRPVQDRPTLFYEIIQRKGCRGFGKGNFKALFESIEREQALRGNL